MRFTDFEGLNNSAFRDNVGTVLFKVDRHDLV